MDHTLDVDKCFSQQLEKPINNAPAFPNIVKWNEGLHYADKSISLLPPLESNVNIPSAVNTNRGMSNFEDTCRTCMNKADAGYVSLFSERDSTNTWFYSDILNLCTSVKVVVNDNLPTIICQCCASLAEQCLQFQQKCKYSEEKLHEIFEKYKESHLENSNNQPSNKLENVDNQIKTDGSDIIIMPSSVDIRQKTYTIVKTESQERDPNEQNVDIGETVKHKRVICKRNFDSDKFGRRKPVPCNQKFNKPMKVQTENKQKIPFRNKEEKNEKRSSSYVCNICGKLYKNTKQLHGHINIVHSGKKPYKCEFCGRAFNVQGNLKRHLLIHSGVKPHTCDECSAAFIQLVQLQDHIRRHHTFEKPFSCSKCDKRYVVSLDLKRHLETHKNNSEDAVIDGKHICGICKQQFDSTEKLKLHKISHMSYSHLCSECGRSFSTKRGLNLHQETHAEKHEECSECGKHFSSKFKLQLHLRSHGPKKFLCSDCGKSFVTKNSLVLHMSTHSEERPFLCTEKGCGKRFRQCTSLKFHTLTHTGEKKYSCDICGKKFAQTGHLFYHKRCHSGEKPYTCLICNKSFPVKTSYDSHMRRHRGEKPYMCEFCNETFFDSSSKNKHKRKSHP